MPRRVFFLDLGSTYGIHSWCISTNDFRQKSTKNFLQTSKNVPKVPTYNIKEYEEKESETIGKQEVPRSLSSLISLEVCRKYWIQRDHTFSSSFCKSLKQWVLHINHHLEKVWLNTSKLAKGDIQDLICCLNQVLIIITLLGCCNRGLSFKLSYNRDTVTFTRRKTKGFVIWQLYDLSLKVVIKTKHFLPYSILCIKVKRKKTFQMLLSPTPLKYLHEPVLNYMMCPSAAALFPSLITGDSAAATGCWQSNHLRREYYSSNAMYRSY